MTRQPPKFRRQHPVGGYVVDFIDVYYQNYHWPAFNLADSAITGGVILLLLDGLILSRPGKQSGDN